MTASTSPPWKRREKVLCAVSGGADSVYLLHRCLEGAAGHGYAVCAAHYDHGLRGEESGARQPLRRGHVPRAGRGVPHGPGRRALVCARAAARHGGGGARAALRLFAGGRREAGRAAHRHGAQRRRQRGDHAAGPWRAARACAAWAASRPGGGTSCGPCWPSRARRWRSISPRGA